MKRITFCLFVMVGITAFVPEISLAYDFSNTSSTALIEKAWNALEKGDMEEARAYADKCIELYRKRASLMQSELTDYPTDTGAKKINSYWALNDVATALYIKGEALLKDGMLEDAKEVYQELIDKYRFGQCWDPEGWFWKPAEAATDRLAMIQSGIILDFGDYRSVTLVVRAWEALEKDDMDAVMGYANKCIELYSKEAQKMQASLSDFVQGTNEEVHSFWALNDVATAHFIKGMMFERNGNLKAANQEYRQIVDKYEFGQCWDPKGWFWKPSEVAKLKLG